YSSAPRSVGCAHRLANFQENPTARASTCFYEDMRLSNSGKLGEECAMEELEIKEKIEETEKGHEGSQSSKLRIGLLIAPLAAIISLLDAGGKSAQTEAINANLQASDLWAFFQAKTARMTTIQTAGESAKLSLLGDLPAEAKAAIQSQIDAWNAAVARYDS